MCNVSVEQFWQAASPFPREDLQFWAYLASTFRPWSVISQVAMPALVTTPSLIR